MTQLLSKLSRMQRIKQANQTKLCKVKGSFVSRSFCIRYANIRVQRSQYKCFSTLCHGQNCLKATVSGAERKDQGVKRKREEKGKKSSPADLLKGKCWLKSPWPVHTATGLLYWCRGWLKVTIILEERNHSEKTLWVQLIIMLWLTG